MILLSHVDIKWIFTAMYYSTAILSSLKKVPFEISLFTFLMAVFKAGLAPVSISGARDAALNLMDADTTNALNISLVRILLVDDDNGASYENYFEFALMANG